MCGGATLATVRLLKSYVNEKSEGSGDRVAILARVPICRIAAPNADDSRATNRVKPHDDVIRINPGNPRPRRFVLPQHDRRISPQ